MKKALLLFLVINCVGIAAAQNKPTKINKDGTSVKMDKDSTLVKMGKDSIPEKSIGGIRFKLIASSNNTWGYDVFLKKELKIHQLTIPGKPGDEGFKTQADARRIAEIVVNKMRKGEESPTIGEEELNPPDKPKPIKKTN